LSEKLFTSLLRLKIAARNVINQTFATSWFLPYLAKPRVCREGVPGRGTGFLSVPDQVPGFVLTNPGIEKEPPSSAPGIGMESAFAVLNEYSRR